MNSETKKCKKCYSDIHCQAKICPHCGCGQGLFGFIHAKEFVGTMIVIIFFIGFVSFILIDKKMSQVKKSSFLELTPVVLQIHKYNAWDRHNIACLGEIKNPTNSRFYNVYFEVSLFDKNNNLVDAFSFNDQDISISENGTTKFKAYNVDTNFDAEKSKCIVRIVDAAIKK